LAIRNGLRQNTKFCNRHNSLDEYTRIT